jgi:hypothetical protein
MCSCLISGMYDKRHGMKMANNSILIVKRFRCWGVTLTNENSVNEIRVD